MKITYVLAILLVILMVGCATTKPTAPTTPTTPGTPTTPTTPTTPETPTTETPAAGETPATVGADVTFNGRAGFDPATVTIKAGSALSILVEDTGSSEYVFTAVETGAKTTKVKDGEKAELAFEKAGKYTVSSVPFNKKLSVTVE